MLLVHMGCQASDFENIDSNILTASMSAMRKEVVALRLQIFEPVTWSIAKVLHSTY